MKNLLIIIIFTLSFFNLFAQQEIDGYNYPVNEKLKYLNSFDLGREEEVIKLDSNIVYLFSSTNKDFNLNEIVIANKYHTIVAPNTFNSKINSRGFLFRPLKTERYRIKNTNSNNLDGRLGVFIASCGCDCSASIFDKSNMNIDNAIFLKAFDLLEEDSIKIILNKGAHYRFALPTDIKNVDLILKDSMGVVLGSTNYNGYNLDYFDIVPRENKNYYISFINKDKEEGCMTFLFITKKNKEQDTNVTETSNNNQGTTSTAETILYGLSLLYSLGSSDGSSYSDSDNNSNTNNESNTEVQQTPCLEKIIENDYTKTIQGYKTPAHKIICGNGYTTHLFYYSQAMKDASSMGTNPVGWYSNVALGYYYGKDFEGAVKKVCECN